MLRITRLHVLIAGIGVLCLGYGLFNWWRSQGRLPMPHPFPKARPVQPVPPSRPVAKVNPEVSDTLDKQRRWVTQSIAIVGEAYTPLRRKFGDIPQISRPLHVAKEQQAKGMYKESLASARASWLALKIFRTRVGQKTQTYQVVRGDTLWRIAAAHSPARAGQGWVTIWKANRQLINNFNRIEVGWTLTIPPERSEYDMPFWKPH